MLNKLLLSKHISTDGQLVKFFTDEDTYCQKTSLVVLHFYRVFTQQQRMHMYRYSTYTYIHFAWAYII